MNQTTSAQMCVIISACILLSGFAAAQEDAAKFAITVTSDKPSYNPGDLMRVSVNITNAGTEEALTKELHAKVIATSWFGMTAHTESKSYSRLYRPNSTAYGYVEVPIPRYTPWGKYEIQIWATYGSPEGKRQVAEEGDVTTQPGTAEIEVNMGIVFILVTLGLFGIIVYILSSLKGRRRPYYAPQRRPATPHAPKPTDASIEYAIIVALVICIALSLIYVGVTKREKETFSVLYLKPDSYSNYVRDNTVTFTYGVECYEKFPTDYQLTYYLGNKTLDKEAFSLCKEGPMSIRKMEKKKTLNIPSDTKYPVKLRIVLKSWDKEYENVIWLRGVAGEGTEK